MIKWKGLNNANKKTECEIKNFEKDISKFELHKYTLIVGECKGSTSLEKNKLKDQIHKGFW